MRTSTVWLLVVAASAAWAACDDDGDDRGPCGEFNWRSETTNEIVCPYTDDCACPAEGVCCVAVGDDDIEGAECSELADCSGLAFECDGPEDCEGGTVCCADMNTGGGSSCRDAADCFDVDEVVMCREDGDCGLGENCLPAEDGTYFEDVAGYCDL